MEDKNKRNQYLKIKVSQAELDAIKKKFQNSGMSTLSDFVRAIILEKYTLLTWNSVLVNNKTIIKQ